jgi:hypothetical protein
LVRTPRLDRIIKEGWLEKRSRQEPGRSNWRYTFLFNDIMVYAVAMEDKYGPHGGLRVGNQQNAPCEQRSVKENSSLCRFTRRG